MTERFLSPFGNNAATRGARFVLRALPRTAVLPILAGPMRGQRWIVGAGVHSCWLGVYERGKQAELVRILRAGDAFLDVGAHSGLYTLLGARLVGAQGRVYALEPAPANLAMLDHHLELNRLHNVTVIRAAAGARPASASFASGDSSYTGRLGEGDLTVRVEQLDDLLERDLIRPPKLIKIDVEGAEADVLEGARRLLETARPIVLLATHGDRARQLSTQALEAAGYRLRSLGTPDELVAEPEPPADQPAHRRARGAARD